MLWMRVRLAKAKASRPARLQRADSHCFRTSPASGPSLFIITTTIVISRLAGGRPSGPASLGPAGLRALALLLKIALVLEGGKKKALREFLLSLPLRFR